MSKKNRRDARASKHPSFLPSLRPAEQSHEPSDPEAALENSPPSALVHIDGNRTMGFPLSPYRARYLLIASLGNPSPYTNTLHSAGHHLLDALRSYLAFPAYSKMLLRAQFKTHRISNSSRHETLVLWQCPSSMNVSGKSVQDIHATWQRWLRQQSHGKGTRATDEAKLVVLHDELEAELGKIRVRQGGSAKGHNGIKSVATHLQGGMNGFVRIGVGIGRPQSRDPDVVSDYVLREMTQREIEKVRAAAPAVAKELLKICGDPGEEAIEGKGEG